MKKRWLKTGDVLKGFAIIWPFINEDMVRAAADNGKYIGMQFEERGGYFYEPQSIKQYLLRRHDVCESKKQEALKVLGLNFNQLKLLHTA